MRGSSTRGAVGALIEMARLMRAGCPAGFTSDGPKGPRHVAKMGAVLLAKKTGQPIMPFSVSARALGTKRQLGPSSDPDAFFTRASDDRTANVRC